MREAKRWTVLQKKPNRSGKRWWVYPPGHMLDRSVGANRRFATWDEAIDYVFDEGLHAKRQQSMRTRFRAGNPSFKPVTVRCPEIFGDAQPVTLYTWNHDVATGEAS
jgi:hypothetical protein